MAYGFQPGLSMPESDFPLEERIPGYYGYCQPENGYSVGYGLPSVATCPVSNHNGTEAENTCMNNAIPSPCPYGFLSANWLEEQQSWYPQPAPYLFDDGQSSYPEPAKCFPNDGQSWCPESLPFSSDGSQSWCPDPPTYPVDGRQPWFPEPPPYPVDGRQPWFPEHSSYSPYGWSSGQQTTGNSVIGFENFGISGVSDFSVPQHGMDLALQHSVNRDSPLSNVKRRNSCHIGSWDRNIDHDVTANRKARRQSMYNPSTVNDNKPFFTSAINVDRNLESTEFQIHLVDFPSNSNKHLASFVDSVKQIRNKYPASDSASNPGRIWSVTMMFPSDAAVGSQMTVTVIGDIIPQPVTCIQKDNALVRNVIMDALHQAHQYPPLTDALLSICGCDEYLQSQFMLKSHIRIQRENFLQLRLHSNAGTMFCLARTHEDDLCELNVDDLLEYAQYWRGIKDRLKMAVGQYMEQTQHVLNHKLQLNNVLEAVKEICYTLRGVETEALRNAVSALYRTCLQPEQNWLPNSINTAKADVQDAVVQLSRALSDLINLFTGSFYTDFQAQPSNYSISSSRCTNSQFSFHLYAANNLPDNWTKSDSNFSLSCSVIYSGRRICPEIKSRSKKATKSLFSMVIWDEEITLPLPVSSLPYESILFVTLKGTDESSTNATTHAWTCLPLYSGQSFVRGSVLLSMMCNLQPPPVVTPGAFDVTLPTLVTVQVDFLERDIVFAAPCPEVGLLYSQAPFEEPSNQLEVLVHRNSVLLLSEGDKHCLWRYRSCCNKQRNILPLVLGSAPGWDPESISAMHTVLRGWKFCHPLEALGLLNACFSDQNIREMACQQIGYLSNDELLQYLPQLVQAIKFEWNLDSSLVRLLLERSLQNIQIAHQLYWLLKNALHQPHYRGRFQKVLAALEFCFGKTLNDEFLKEKNLIRILHNIAEKVKNAQDSKRQETLQSNLNKLQDLFLEVHVCRLPQDPSIVVKGINKRACSYFKSNASPLKISFTNADPLGKDIDVIFKAGDDLRQDMLVLQIIQEMDRIWLREGLDLRIVTYRCLSTGTKQGLVQMVPNATTLAKIHQKSGLLGPLMDGSIKKWFSSVNCPQAEDNFFYSCAGWCVATFILGVCDRHNDNIMITDTGHVFHIDFGKFLGHAQKFGSIKRDRAPFIFTSEMDHFITQGGKSPQRSQEFVELCCRAYNILRKHSHLLINLLELMLQAGLPELCNVGDLRYVHNNLRPQDSELQATSYFTSKIKESLQCLPVKLNNMIHILAKMSLSGSSKSNSQICGLDYNTNSQESVKVPPWISREGLYTLGAGPWGKDPVAEKSPGIQLHISFSKPKLSILLKHLRNVYVLDGSVPAATVEVTLLRHTSVIMRKKVKTKSKSADPTFNEIVEYNIPYLEGYVLTLVVKNKNTFIASLNLRLDAVQMNEDVWYPLRRCNA